MDRDKARNRWAWLPEHMPGVARLIAERRAQFGAAHVAACWDAGVIQRKPGWFFAREGAIAVGTPWGDPVMDNFAAAQITSTQAVLVMREPEAPHGTN